MVALRHKVRSEGDLERSVTTWRIYNENKLNVKATRLSLEAKIRQIFVKIFAQQWNSEIYFSGKFQHFYWYVQGSRL